MKKPSAPGSPTVRIVRALLTLPFVAGALAAEEDTPAPETPPETPAAEAATEEAPAAETPAAAEGDLKNWVQFGVGATFPSGHRPAFQQRYGLPDGPFGGVDGFHYERGFGKDGLFQMDGRGIFDNHDYELNLDFTLPDKGYLRGGYREFRNWYDASGGFFPATDGWFALYPDSLAYDDREVYVEAGLRLPNVPKFTLRYSHTEREGQKGSTIWGDTTATGGLGPRSIVPTILDLNRIRDLVKADLAHTFGVTDVAVGVRYERQDNDDARLMRRFPGEGAGYDRHVTQRDQSQADLFNVHAHTQSRLNDKLLLTAGYAYTDLSSDTSGYRVYGSTFDPDFAQRLPASSTFDNLIGGSQLSQHVGNLNFMATLAEKLVLVPSLRVEGRDTDGQSFYFSPAAPFAGSSYEAQSQRGLLDVSEGLDLRYSGVTNWLFYARGAWLQGSGDLQETRVNRDTGASALARQTDDQRFSQKYTAGANWYPLRRLSLGAEYYHKRRENDFDHSLDSTSNAIGSPNRYSAFLRAQSFTTDDANFRVTWRPRGNLSLVGRYDMQLSTIDTRPDNLPEVQTADLTSYIGSGSVSWVPLARLYVQGNLSYVWDRTSTPASDLLPAVQNAENTYWTGNATLGYALDDKTDLEAQYLFYRADNYEDNSAYGQPYGAAGEDHAITAGVVRRMSKRVRVSLKYGFFTSHDELSGGNRDYDAHMLYSTLQYRF